jgi:hypothetical protein
MTVTPTIRIKSDIPGCEGGLDINAADFDPKVHVEFEAAKASAQKADNSRQRGRPRKEAD